MNNLDKILEKINKTAADEVSAANAAADSEIAAIYEACDAKIKSLEIRTASNIKAEAARIAARAESSADMKKREVLLAAKVSMIDRAFAEAASRLTSLSDDEYSVLLTSILVYSVSERLNEAAELRGLYGDSEEYCTDFTVLFNASDRDRYASAVIDDAKSGLAEKNPEWADVSLAVSDETAKIDGGLILRYGDIESNCSISALVAQEKTQSGTKIGKILFG